MLVETFLEQKTSFGAIFVVKYMQIHNNMMNYKKNLKSGIGLYLLIAGPKRGRPTPGFSIFLRSFICLFGRSD